VVRKKVLRLLDIGIVYLISDSARVSSVQVVPKKGGSPVQVVPKKGGITVIKNDNNELILTRITTGWRVCMDC